MVKTYRLCPSFAFAPALLLKFTVCIQSSQNNQEAARTITEKQRSALHVVVMETMVTSTSGHGNQSALHVVVTGTVTSIWGRHRNSGQLCVVIMDIMVTPTWDCHGNNDHLYEGLSQKQSSALRVVVMETTFTST